MKHKKIALWTTRFLTFSLFVGLCSTTVRTAQDTGAGQLQMTDEMSASENTIESPAGSDFDSSDTDNVDDGNHVNIGNDTGNVDDGNHVNTGNDTGNVDDGNHVNTGNDTDNADDSSYLDSSNDAGDTNGSKHVDSKSDDMIHADDADDNGAYDIDILDTEVIKPVSLLVPNNLDFTIDPWNLSGQGQIYSQQFEIANGSDTACVLYLQDIICCSEGENNAVIVTDAEDVYAKDAANVYLEMVLDTGDVLNLSEKGQEYTIVLEPKSELTFWFTGKVNEKTKEDWKDKKVSVKLKYAGEPVCKE